MTKDEIIEMAIQAGIIHPEMVVKHLEAFANLVAQEVRDRIMFGSRDDWVLAEREACAKLCENMTLEWEDQPEFARIELSTMMDCALAIRARGEQV